MKRRIDLQKIILLIVLIGVVLFPMFASPYFVHVGVLILIWSFIVTAWSYMGRFGIVSICHGAFMGIGAYSAFLLFNFFNWCPWLGLGIGILLSAILSGVIGYACFRFGVIGHYFAITTLVIGELLALGIISFRRVTGGRLGLTLKSFEPVSLFDQFYYLRFDSKMSYYYFSLVLLIIALYLWKKIDKSKIQIALKAIGDSEIAASSVGIAIVKYKTSITVLSAVLTSIGGVIYGQYISYLDPISMVGSSASLGICFKAILGGVFSLFGPVIGTAIIVSLEEYIRVAYGTTFTGYSNIANALVIIFLIIYLPKGIYGSLVDIFTKMWKEEA